MSKIRPVHILMSKKIKRLIVHCPECPIAPTRFGNNQKSACIHLIRDMKANKDKGESLLKKVNQCEFYEKDSLQKLQYGINAIVCNQI